MERFRRWWFIGLSLINNNFINKYLRQTQDIYGDKLFSTGGRVLNFVSIDEDLKFARINTIKLIKSLNWENGFYRSDIGHKVIKRWELLEVI